MTLIEQIKEDRAKGTSGPWEVGCGDGRILALYQRPDNTKYFWDIAKVTQTSVVSDDGEYHLAGGGDKFNARRIARVPDMEEALLAADELIKAIEHERNMPCQDIDMQLKAIAAVDAALAAYRKATGTEE